ncbi:MAG: signal peptidase II [Bacilli bacterium]|nr:signal peptidase II [Bacilli bacterium]
MNKEKAICFLATSVFVVDQIIKFFILHFMEIHQRIVIIPHFFSLFFVKNTGAAFSILENYTFLFIGISIGFLVNMFLYIRKEENDSSLFRWSLGFLLGGVVGNLVDRIFYQAVVDYLAFEFFQYSFPVFNFADSCINIGICLFLLYMIIQKKSEREK